MIEPDMRKAIFLLHEEGMGVREIARRLGISRNTIRAVIQDKGAVPAVIRKDKIQIDPELLKRLYEECDGWKWRVHEKLVEEEGVEVTYPTLTRMLRDLGIGRVHKTRCDRVPDEPGAEMQHDTSPYVVKLAGAPTKLNASLLYLRYSKRRYLKFYRIFNRFKMKCFFHEALTYWEYAAELCIIDNTNLARLRGTGKDAVIVPEMEAFAKQYGFRFSCHELGHANRKAGEERSFWTVETNFFPGRTFESVEDLNQQAFDWATVRLYHRPVAKSGLVPVKAFEHERPYLVQLMPHLPAPYLIHDRLTDQYGYVSFDGNFYWVPGSGREELRVLEYADQLKIYRGREFLTEYKLPADGVKNERVSPEGFPEPRHQPSHRNKPTVEEEKRLRAMGEVVGAYLDFALAPKGKERHGLVRDLFRLSQQMTSALFIETLKRALKYRIARIEILRRIAVMLMSAGVETLPYAEVDERLQEREAYVEGRLSDEPDFSPYDEMLEEHDG
jgi:transposase